MKALTGARVVVADSDRALLEMLQIRLDLAGCQTFPARTGPLALQLAEAVRPTLMILDLKLPELDGFGVVEELILRHGKLPFKVMFMARGLEHADLRRAAALGVRACVAKPFSGADMLDRVNRLLTGAPQAPTKEVVWV
jgi:DNA-binding response OmpR family regulator